MMRLLAWAAWACAEAAGVAFVERIVSAYAPNVAAIFAADANGDGRIEVWSAADGAYGLRSYEHNWRHDLPDEYDTYVLESGSAWVDVVAADFDGDGALEVAAATSTAVSWNEYEYLQWVGYSTPIVESMYEDAIVAIFAADVDGDADVDVVAAHRGVGGPVSWYENLAGSGFASTSWASWDMIEGFVATRSSGSSCYALPVSGWGSRLTWQDARAQCRASGMDLITIEGDEENYEIHGWVVGPTTGLPQETWYWTGLNELGKANAWAWANHRVCAWYRDWARVTVETEDSTTTTKEPYDLVAEFPEECVAASDAAGGGGLWADEQCEHEHHYVCEAPVERGATAQKPCGKGTYARQGWTECRSCDWGDYNDGVGRDACESCPSFSPARLLADAFNGPRIHDTNRGGSVRCAGHLGGRQGRAYAAVIAFSAMAGFFYLAFWLLFLEWPNIVRQNGLAGYGMEFLRPVIRPQDLGGEVGQIAFFFLAIVPFLGVACGCLPFWISPILRGATPSSSDNYNTGRRTATSLDRGCDPEGRHPYLIFGLVAYAVSALNLLLLAPVVPTRRFLYECLMVLPRRWQRARSVVTRARLRRQVKEAMAAWEAERAARGAAGEARVLACTLCQSDRAAALNVPCNHLFLCLGCAQLFRDESGDICHACRAPSTIVDAVTRDQHSAASLAGPGAKAKWFFPARARGAEEPPPAAPGAVWATEDDGEAMFAQLKRASEHGSSLGLTSMRRLKEDVTTGRDSDAAAYLRRTCAACGDAKHLVVDAPCGHRSLCRPCAEEFRGFNGEVCSRCREPSALCDPARSLMCSVCCDQIGAADLVTLDTCGHTICVGCSADFVRSALGDVAGQVVAAGLSCPLRPTGCSGVVHLSTVRRLVTLDTTRNAEVLPITEEEFSRVERFIAEASIPETQRFYCTYKDCAKVFAVDRDDVPLDGVVRSLRLKMKKSAWPSAKAVNRLRGRVAPDDDARGAPDAEPAPFFVTCVYCQRQSCFYCKIPAHRALTCAEARAIGEGDESTTTDLIAATCKNCPKCGFGVTHFHGHACHHIMPVTGCPNCGHHFCYRCLRPGHSGSACGCRLFCQNDGVAGFVAWEPYPHDTRCGCRFCPDCAPGAPCPQCDGGCVVCRSKVPRPPRSLAGVATWWPEGKPKKAPVVPIG